ERRTGRGRRIVAPRDEGESKGGHKDSGETAGRGNHEHLRDPIGPRRDCTRPLRPPGYFEADAFGVTVMFLAANQGCHSMTRRPALTAGSCSARALASSSVSTRKTNMPRRVLALL